MTDIGIKLSFAIELHSFNQGIISGMYFLYTSKGFGPTYFFKTWDSFSLAKLFQVQFDELSCLSVPPARELRDLHKDLWLRWVWVVPPVCRGDFVWLAGLARRSHRQSNAWHQSKKDSNNSRCEGDG